jgi:type IV pilus assembly protein PilC
MAKFAYTARDEDDHKFSGTMNGATAEEVIERLSQKEYLDISLEELNFDGSKKVETFFDKFKSSLVKMQNRIPLKIVVFFTRQLATMLEAGVPISEALLQLAEDEKPVFRKIILQLEEDVSSGKSFSESLARHPGAFNNMFVAVVRSGETSGALVKVLDQMAIYMENTEALRQKIKGAMRYPTFIGLFVLVMLIGIMWKLVPVFSSMYGSFNATLPLPTRMLVAVSNVVVGYFPLVVLSLILVYAGIKAALTNPSFLLLFDNYILRVPIYGIILQKNIWARFCRTLALLMESGTPILQAVEITSAVVNNSLFSSHLETVYEKLRNGEPLSVSLKETALFSRLVTQLAATGEKSGGMGALLVKAAEFYEREIKITVESLSSIIEPTLIIVLGGIMGGILIALYLPVFYIGRIIQ